MGGVCQKLLTFVAESLKEANSSVDTDSMTRSLFGRPARQRPVLVSITTHFRKVGDDFLRECVVRMPDGALAVRPVAEARLVALGAVAA